MNSHPVRAVPSLALPSPTEIRSLDITHRRRIHDAAFTGSAKSGISITEISEDKSDLQMAEEAEILNNLHLFDARFLDLPETKTPIISYPFDISTAVEHCDTIISQPMRMPVYINKKQNSDEPIRDDSHVVESPSEIQIQNLPIYQSNQEEIVGDDFEPFASNVQGIEKPNVQKNKRNCKNVRTINGEKESSTTPLIFTKPYFRSVKSYLKDCNRMTEVCRICFCSLDDKEVIKLYEDTSDQDSMQIKSMLKFVLPDLDLEMYPNTVICTKCVELVLHSYQLKEKWLLTEEKLQKIIEKKKGVISSVADLVIIGKLLTDKKVQNFEDIPRSEQEGTQKNLTESIVENLLQPSEKGTPVSVFYGQLNLNEEHRNNMPVHQKNKKRSSEKQTYGTGPFMCEQCGHMVTNVKSLKRHLIKHNIPKEKRIRRKEDKSKQREFMCEVCGQLFFNPSHLRRHASKHAEYACSFCNKVFNHQFRLREHIKCTHIRNCYQCHLCGKQVSYARSLQMHMMVHYPKPKHRACHICGKKFRYPCNLNNHLRTHTREKLLHCEYCGRSLKHEFSLRKHIQIYHMNQGKNVCEVCNKPYWKKCDLEKHKIRCHGGSICNRRESNKQGNGEVISAEEIYADHDYYSVVYED
ncbi:hypothetical protein Zmor_023871 [Zophobas morio]|uniref:C2H2-type domain-containing protein n=1 Tax=Zophobas morio TaxID=2755281 RepID=A0AA38HZ77_9CUCU|nr:hypothetical protein Zmor_023871 [Zophobas morio]